MFRYLVFGVLFFSCFSGYPSNLRIVKTEITAVTEETARVNITLSWDNSWRNIYNYDAVYVFGKYMTEDHAVWEPVVLSDSGNRTVEDSYVAEKAEKGIFVYRQKEGRGRAEVTLEAVWDLTESGTAVLAALLREKRVRFDFQAIEMVYIPVCPFYAGDGVSENSFSSPDFGRIPGSCDLIGNNSNYSYTASGGVAAHVTTHVNNGSNRWSAGVPAWWQVNFKSPKRILYFGVSSPTGLDAGPESDWYLLGGNTEAAFDTLWKGGAEYWSNSRSSYPVQQAVRVEHPGDYQYYRIYVKDVNAQRKPYWNDVQLLNIAMTEEDLEKRRTAGVLIDRPESVSFGDYPCGYDGFYAMKYELSQEQYVTFLNKLTYSGQYSRTVGGLLDGVGKGEYIFGGHPSFPSHRNGIVLTEKGYEGGNPAIFGCNMGKDDLPDQEEDGQTLACNYLSPSDLLAYADWAGLRPLSELEYEKMCNPPAGSKWKERSYAWGNDAIFYGEELRDNGKETEYLAVGHSVAGAATEGPVRSGAVLRSGRSRMENGSSFWGVEDLSGNVSEIYYNAEVYGRQFKGNIQGDGKLSEFGETDIPSDCWPRDIRAFGIRGGSYKSSGGELTIADRSKAGGYFRDLSQREEEVGGRLGYTVPARSLQLKLVLENGQVAENTVLYDTVCDAGEYRIRAELAEKEGYTYTWYESKDRGETWKYVNGGEKRELLLKNLTAEVTTGQASTFLYRCCVSSPKGSGEQTVGLVVGNGYLLSRLRDTLRPCMESEGFTVEVPLPAKFRWWCPDNGKTLLPTAETVRSSHYDVATEDFKSGENLPSGSYLISLEITIAGRCKMKQQAEVFALPYTVNPFPAGDETFTYQGDSQRLVRIWGGQDRQEWRIVNSETGTLQLGADNGMLTGLAQTICNNVKIELTCADFPDKMYSEVIVEKARNFVYTGRAQSIYLLPGTYQMICKGAGGGNDGQVGAPGGLASGDLTLEETRLMYVYVGGAGASSVSGAGGGWNGGGNAGGSGSSGAGGGGTDFRTGGTAWMNRIMVAGGGGGGGNSCGSVTGGVGGGINGGINSAGSIATQTSGNAIGQAGHRSGDGGGGGGGYWGGYAASCDGGGGGGSGYISGFPDCVIHTSGIVFKNAKLVAGGGAPRCMHGSASITIYREQ